MAVKSRTPEPLKLPIPIPEFCQVLAGKSKPKLDFIPHPPKKKRFKWVRSLSLDICLRDSAGDI